MSISCLKWLTDGDVGLITSIPANSDPNNPQRNQVCTALGIPQENCSNETGFILRERCNSKEVLDGIIKHAANPQGFLNRHGPAEGTRAITFAGYYDTLFLGLEAFGGIGTGGFMMPKLQRETFRTLLETQNPKWNVNHFVHGAPLTVDSKATGYSHRKQGYNLPDISRYPEWTNIVLNDTAFNGDVHKLRSYGNYQPSVQVPGYEKLVFGDNADELGRIRTEYDPLGGFDSPRYPQRNRRAALSNSPSSVGSSVGLSVESSVGSSVASSDKISILQMLSTAVLVTLATKL